MIKLKELGLAMVIALAVVMATNIASVRAVVDPRDCDIAPAGGDGVVDINDVAACAGNFGKTGPAVLGDVNKDGIVDIFDLLCIVMNYGKILPAPEVPPKP